MGRARDKNQVDDLEGNINNPNQPCILSEKEAQIAPYQVAEEAK
jgi:hypothetical protein